MRVERTVSGQKFKVEYKHFEMHKWAMNFTSGIPKSCKVIKLQTCLPQFDLDVTWFSSFPRLYANKRNEFVGQVVKRISNCVPALREAMS